jgi:hypothetical protein
MYMTEVLGSKCISQNMLDMKNETCEPTTSPVGNSVIIGCKMYMAEVLGAKSISRNKMDMKNEKLK